MGVIQFGEPGRFAMAIPLRSDFDASQLRAVARKTKNAPQARRLLALAAIYEGASRTEAARIGGVTLQIVRDWVLKFNAQGPDGLIDCKPPGQPSRLTDAHRSALAAMIESGPLPAVHGLSALGLLWAVGTVRIQKVYPPDVRMVASTTRGGPRKTLVPDAGAVSAAAMLAKASWRGITWRRGTKRPLRAKFATLRVRVADGPAVQLGGHAAQHLPGTVVWLVGEHRSSGERKYYLSDLPSDTTLKQLASLIKARWVCEHADQHLKEELGLDHFEGRSWHGLNRHAMLKLIAHLFLQHLRLQAASSHFLTRSVTVLTD
jgi:transposase